MRIDPCIALFEQRGVELKPSMALLLYELTRAPGVYLTHEQVAETVRLPNDWAPRDVHITARRLRRACSVARIPYDVRSTRGRGVYAVRLDPLYRLPW